ncbi:MAG: glycosyltransferase [Oscillospiraceae bacterium]
MTISLCMIVKNEENTLQRCLDSISDIVDEIIIVDTGSEDNTKSIALRYTKNVYDFKWIDDFSAARNYSFSKATKEYILWLDSDDVLLESDRQKLINLKNNFDNSFDVVMMKYNLGSDDINYPTCTFMRERLLKREKGFMWNDPIHEYIIISGKILNTDICITHKRMHGKTDRNLRIFKKMITQGKELSHRNKFYYARELFLNGHFNEAIVYYNQFLNTTGGLTSNYMDASIDLASCYRSLNDDKNVLKSLLSSFEHDSPRAEICCQLGFFYKQKKDYLNAIFWYDIASKIKKPSNQWGSLLHEFYDFTPNMELSSCYFHIGNLDMAIKYNNIASTFKPDNPMVKQNTEYFNSLKRGMANWDKKRVLVASPVHQKPAILKAFLASIENIIQDTVSIDFIFVDDNIDEQSSELLKQFQTRNKNTTILVGEKATDYICDDNTHRWSKNIILKVIDFKNKIITHAIQEKYDYLFFVDSDIVIHPFLIEHLKSKQKNIVSEIFWTQWLINGPLLPNVWMFDKYDLVPKQFGETISDEESSIRLNQFISDLKVPGLYEVGGLGACTLISREALLSGVNFTPIKNITFPGEDRYFCIRAIVLGLDLFVDTHFPAYHIYRENQLDGVANYIKSCQLTQQLVRKYKSQGNKLTLSMVVKNESGRYLKDVLAKLNGVIDEAVIIDDASTDNTIEICHQMLPNIPLHIVKNETSMFKNEIELRKKQWSETIKTNPDWILNLDADEIFENSFYENIKSLINQENIDVYLFRLYDMWDKNHYREDQYWCAHNYYRPFLMRFQPNFAYKWLETPQHCGRLPINILSLPKCTSQYRLKHYGWACPEDRKSKYERYKILDPDAIYGVKNQYESILDEKPNLSEWFE